METVISDNKGDTESVKILRNRIQTELEAGNTVKVKLLQPGVMYQKDGAWKTVIDFMNEWAGKPVRFQSNLVPIKDCKVKFDYSNDMFFTGPKLYQKNKMCKGLLEKLLPTYQKSVAKHWDLLLGESNGNKDWLYDTIQNHPVLERTFLTYFGKDTTKGYWSDSVVRPNKHTAETLGPLANRFNTQIRCSDLLDPAIYNMTHYTAMIETTVHNDFAMFSEKEAKPIIAKRPFVIFGSCGQLKAFRSLGFKTFDGVIDESYDLIEDKHERWQKVLDSMLQLTKMNHIKVHNELASILIHNKEHFENNEWKRCLTWDSYQ
tara:strand:+ start:1074 stop:2027 length:954 start_codon:yes stop_codon:yes gene_type:complete